MTEQKTAYNIGLLTASMAVYDHLLRTDNVLDNFDDVRDVVELALTKFNDYMVTALDFDKWKLKFSQLCSNRNIPEDVLYDRWVKGVTPEEAASEFNI